MLLLVVVKARNPNFKMNFIKRGAVWNVFFRIDGRQYSLSTSQTDLSAAQIQGARIFLAHVEKCRGGGDVRDVADAIELYWRWHEAPGEGKKPSWNSAHKYEVCLREVASLLGVTRLADLAQIASGLSARRLGVSESNFVSLVRQAAALFNRRFLAWAKRAGKELANPFAGHVPPTPKPKQFVAPSAVQVKALNAAAECELQGNELLLFKACLGAGMRVGEATHIKWADVLERSIWIESTSEHKTKNGKSREVPVSASLIAFFESYRGIPTNYVITDVTPPRTSKYGRPLRRAERTARRLITWLKSKGVRDKRPIHWLRKVFASRVTEQHDIHVASKWLGHSSVKVTEQVYAGVASDKFAEVI